MADELGSVDAAAAELLEHECDRDRRAVLTRHRAMYRAYRARTPNVGEHSAAPDYWSALHAAVASADVGVATIAREALRIACARWPESHGVQTPHPLPVLAAAPTGRDGLLIRLGIPASLRDPFRWRAGQHVGVVVDHGGLGVERSYSICAPTGACADGYLQIAVRRASGGLVSTLIADRIRPGSTLPVRPPAGVLTWPTDDEATPRPVLLVAAGSGITPLYGIVASALEESDVAVTLAVVERRPEDVMLGEQLEQLRHDHPGRLRMVGVWTRGAQGRPSADTLASALAAPLAELRNGGTEPAVYLCGPDAVADLARAALGRLDVDAASVHVESFTTDRAVTTAARPGGILRVRVDGAEHDVELTPGETLLAAMLRAGLPQPFSCLSGACGTCRTEVVAGAVGPPAAVVREQPLDVLACIAANAV